MRKSYVNYTLFIFMVLLGLTQAVSGFLLWLVISGGGYQGGRNVNAGTFIWPRPTWISLHDWTAVALLGVIIIHVILHWNWITAVTRKILANKP
jgi:hypothetical protein